MDISNSFEMPKVNGSVVPRQIQSQDLAQYPALKRWFDEIAAGDVVGAKKPAPDIYHYVLGRLRHEPEECVAFEDSENGLRAARAARIPAVITVNDYTRTHDFTGAALVVDHLGEPDRPCRVLAGVPLGGATMVDLAVLRRLSIPQ